MKDNSDLVSDFYCELFEKLIVYLNLPKNLDLLGNEYVA